MRTPGLWKSIVAGLIIAAGFSAAHPQQAETDHPATDVPIRVMTFNIRVGTAPDGPNRWEKRKNLVFDTIRSNRPDLLGLQEALRFQIDAILEALPEYAEIGQGRADGKTEGEYSPILYRRERFQVQDQETFWFSDTPSVPGSMTWGNHYPRICTWALLLDVGSGFRFYHYNLHLDHQSQESRVKSVVLLSRRIARRTPPLPVIVTGDFNAGEDNPAIRFMRGVDSDLLGEPSPELVDTFRRLHPDADQVGTFNGFEGNRTGPKIDYIFASRSFHVVSAEIDRENRDRRYPSDHFPVTAVLR